jgi:uncharacterized membrane protein YfcA
MEYFVICIAALISSGLTLFSGFGLGTLLLPVFAVFFPIDIAIALTAIVHLMNNLFKLALLGKYADKMVVLKFGLPAVIAAFLGAWILMRLSGLQPIVHYQFLSHEFHVIPMKLIIAILMAIFSMVELIPRFETISFEKKYLPLGGILSGFFGGLSGHQGALRSAFLIRSGLSKEVFIATGVVIACLVDFSRLSVYSTHFLLAGIGVNRFLLLSAVASAFFGAFIGSRLLKKITMRTVQIIVSIMVLAIAIGLGAGLI